jgi:hypothetical protein
MNELKDTETAASKFDDKLHKLIKRAKKQRGSSGHPSFQNSSLLVLT